MSSNIRQSLTFIFLFLISSLLISCGGGGSNGATQAKGTVGILLTDKPADPALVEAINASIAKIELIAAGDQTSVPLYSGDIQVFDLLSLKNEAIPFSFQDDVAIGEYCKIRLTLSDLELVMADNTPDNSSDNPTFHPHLPGNGKLDLVAKNCFTITANEVVTIQIDIDAGNSIHIASNNKDYNFRPVVFVDVLSPTVEGKLVRLNGEITAVDASAQSLRLCNALPDHTMTKIGCVDVNFNQDSAYFNNVDYAGAPRSLDELLADSMIGESVTVVGKLSYEAASSASSTASISSVLLEMDALVVELGEFMQIPGTVSVDADSAGFTLLMNSGSPLITSDNSLGVMFYADAAGINGTRIITRAGDLITPLDVKQPLPVQVDGTLLAISASDPVLNAALVILDQAAQGTEQVTGVITAIGSLSFAITPDAATVCGVATTQLQVSHTDTLEILTVTITDTGSEIVAGGSLQVGQTVGMNGVCGSSDYEIDSVVIVDDQRAL